MAKKAGSAATGPSRQYVRLLRGEIQSKDYVRSAKRAVDAQRRSGPRETSRKAR
jgi:hypothetical protein